MHPIKIKYESKLANPETNSGFNLLLFTICSLMYSFFFDGVKEANLYEIKSWRLRSQNVFIDIDIDDVRNLEDLLRVVLIDEEFGNLKVVGRVY